MFGCCERDKSIQKSDICINSINNKSENNFPYCILTNNNRMDRPSVCDTSQIITMLHSSKNNILEFNQTKNDETEKNSAKFIRNLQTTVKTNEVSPLIHKPLIKSRLLLRPTKTVGCNKDDEKNNVISISDISFVSENNQKENFSKLLLTGDLFFNKEIIINENGMINSKRNKKDGYTVFGLKNSIDASGKLNNDFIINFKRDVDEIGNVETETGKVFEIKFNKERKEYTLYFINPYLYLYYKINNFVYFYPGKDYFLFVGKIFLFINIEKKDSLQIINIQVDNTCKEIKDPEEINKKYSFNENNSPIKIGRIDCDINICEKCISKNHGIIEFSKINQRFYYKNMSNTNGTTLLVKKGDFLKIKGEMNFKLEDVSFKIQEIP